MAGTGSREGRSRLEGRSRQPAFISAAVGIDASLANRSRQAGTYWRFPLSARCLPGMQVGPESAGAHPGPVCYRKGGYLAVTGKQRSWGLALQRFPSPAVQLQPWRTAAALPYSPAVQPQPGMPHLATSLAGASLMLGCILPQ